MAYKIQLDKDKLKETLTASNKFHDSKAKGTYTSKCCDTPLFTSETKLDSGTGWPSYFAPIKDTVLTLSL